MISDKITLRCVQLSLLMRNWFQLDDIQIGKRKHEISQYKMPLFKTRENISSKQGQQNIFKIQLKNIKEIVRR